MRKSLKYGLYVVSIGTFVVALTGCASVSPKVVLDGVLGRYPHYDSNEYNRAVNVEIEAKNLAKDPAGVGIFLSDVENLRLYVAGRPYNERIIKEIDLLEKVSKELQVRLEKGKPSPAYITNKCEDIVILSDNIRKSIGVEKL
jgi:hypothetical protein